MSKIYNFFTKLFRKRMVFGNCLIKFEQVKEQKQEQELSLFGISPTFYLPNYK